MARPARFEIMYHRDTCLFDFVCNLAEWHFACNRHYNRIWLSETGELAPAEREALKSFARVAKQFPYGDSWVGTPFVRYAGDPSMWTHVEALVGREAGRDLRDALRAMESRFDLVWQKDLPRLEALRSRLRTRLSEDRCAKAMNALEAYLGSPFPNVTINLLLSRGRGSVSGGANEGPGHITLAALETDDVGRAVEIVFHEVMHLMEAERFVPLYDAMSCRHRLRDYRGKEYGGEDGWSAHWLVKEALGGAVAPGGCLSLLLGRPVRDHWGEAAAATRRGDLQEAGLSRLTAVLSPLVARYFDTFRTIDESMFEEAFEVFSKEVERDRGSELGVIRPQSRSLHTP